MEKRWLNNYPQGISPEIDPIGHPSLDILLTSACHKFGGLPAFSNMGTSISYKEWEQYSRYFAAFLQNVLGLKKGDRIALMMPNLLQYPVALFGALRAGLVVVNVNPQYTAPELEYQLKDSGAAAIVVLENFAHTLQKVLEKNPNLTISVITTQVGDMFPVAKELLTNWMVKYIKKMVPPWHIADYEPFDTAIRGGAGFELKEVAIKHSDIALLQYTGGTTGVAKGVMLTHGNMLSNIAQLGAWIAHDLIEGKEVFVCPLPLYHIYALTSSLVFVSIGAHGILITNPRDLHAFTHELQKYPVTAMVGVNTLYRSLLDAPEFIHCKMPALKVANAGGMAVQRTVAERWKKATGVPIVESYGLTESSPGALSNRLDIIDWTGTIGMPLPSTEAGIFDEQGQELPPGTIGEICIRGPQVMKGYWKRPQESEQAIFPDGWLRTGDMGFMDDRGCFSITDRKKDMIVVSGFKVFPNQVEDVVAMHPGVLEVAAVGFPDERSGEAVKIVVVRADQSLTGEQLLQHCRQSLTEYKIPRYIEFRDNPLPKSNLGKILRRQIRDEAIAAQQASKASKTTVLETS